MPERGGNFKLTRQLGGIRVNVGEDWLFGYYYAGGAGYGDPIDRDPEMVVVDVRQEAVSIEYAAKIYGVVLDPETYAVDQEKTRKRREEIRQERLAKGKKMSPEAGGRKVIGAEKTLCKIHEYLEVVEKENGEKVISCIKCGNEFGSPGENYKNYALRWTRDIREVKKVGEGVEPIVKYQEYICPGCGTLLQVDVWCPAIDDEGPVWDINVKI